ncbi:hypothetical protein BD830_101155 [Maritimibacter alkaliphilus HTCC2654]|uniref:Lipoprotein n=1 Tax=Maritimibacter alkaliphilus HTCC2654 TaxID=314271 RepID=A3VEP6_9RHOB|nr:hypothetical protein [Maritimibacter alkaliphilus]EAQ13384.1 hypothetical protein RB2654_09949 [Rhodobacterales bacterium HTCC2654] [Maritimibacter alkaliphilus HTCC2654]TYP85197.1 hypothetical protein BD830_101155 [Maritimibacter alkaliphilus HTCC2654]
MRGAAILAAGVAGLAGPGAAACLTAANLDRGVVVTRQATGPTTVTRTGQGTRYQFTRRFDPDTTDGFAVDRYTDILRDGPFPIRESGSTTAVALTGQAPLDFNTTWSSDWRMSGARPRLDPLTRATRAVTEVSSSSNGLDDQRGRTRWQVTYTFLEEKSARVSGCDYRVMGITAEHRDGQTAFLDRYVYFIDLDMAVQTQWTELASGVQRTYGITGVQAR